MSNSSKMYICVKEEVPSHMVPVLVAHAVLRHHMFSEDSGWEEDYNCWVENSFKKCVVSMNKKEFSKALLLEDGVHSWENTTLEGDTSCVTIVVQEEIPNVLKYAKLWKPV